MSLLGKLFKRPPAPAGTAREQAIAAKARGNTLISEDKLADAIEAYRTAIALDPSYGDAYINLAYALREMGRLDESDAQLDQAARRTPNHPRLHYNRALNHRARGQYEAAEAKLRTALALDPSDENTLAVLGDTLAKLRKHDALLDVARQLAAKHPDDLAFQINVCVGEHMCGRTEAALAQLEAMYARQPSAQVAHALGVLLGEEQRRDDAHAWFERALALDPHYAPAKWPLGSLYLLLGDYERGWPLIDAGSPSALSQLAPDERERHLALLGANRLWQGEALDGKRLLLWHEQGFGDTLMMARYLRVLKDRFPTASITAYVPKPLVTLIDRMHCAARVVPTPAPPDIAPASFDVHCSFMNLPARLHTTVATIPYAGGYLSADPHQQAAWAKRLSALPAGLRVGIAWAGNPLLARDHLRSIDFTALRPLWAVRGVQWISLQKSEAAHALRQLDITVTDWMADCHDFNATAALVANLDLVITIDSAPAHLAGALGVPTWMLCRHESEWRWMLERTDSPWYASLTLYRQTAPNDWGAVLDRVAHDLQQLTA